MNQNRREFISTIAAGMAIPMVSNLKKIIPASSEKNFQINLFSKPLDFYDFDFACECCADAGIKGIELTVREGGKINPLSVETTLPKHIEKAGNHNLAIEMIVTGILSATDNLTDRILKTASSHGVKYYRMGWYPYEKEDVRNTMKKCRSNLSELEAVNRKYKINGCYQNHSGEFVGSPVWDLNELFRDLSPEFIGSQFDVRHAMVEGYDTWMLGMRLISGYIKTLAIKDFRWTIINGKQQPVSVPLGEGIVEWDRYFQGIKELNIVAPVSLHIEYPLLETGEDKLPLEKQHELIVKKLKKDTDFINFYKNKYQLI